MKRDVQCENPKNATGYRLLFDMRTLGTLIIAIVGIISFALPVRSAGPVNVPNPTVIGPIPALVPPGDPSHNYPFFSTTADLASYGYVEEEFFFEGTANRYIISDPLTTATIRDGGHPYRTRMIVRRPSSADAFNGTVVLEWQNAAAGYDFDGAWIQSSEHFMRRGYAWIGVSALRAGISQPVTGLKDWSPIRYATLDVTAGGTITNDDLAYDIFSQAAQAVRNPIGVDPTGGLPVDLILAVGASASAGKLVSYHNSIHPLAGVFDGFFVAAGGGKLRTDLESKVFKVSSETDVAGLSGGNQALLRQPDSDHFRHWEVAGSAHLDFHVWQAIGPVRVRDLGPQTLPSCANPTFSRIPFYFVLNAAGDHLNNWVRYEIAPPTAPEIEVVSFGSPNVIARDDFGNALGGIRLSQLVVPTATNTGLNSGPGFCRLYGTFEPFDEASIEALYGNHGAYVNQVARVTYDNLQNGYLVPEDADTTVREAAQSGTGKR